MKTNSIPARLLFLAGERKRIALDKGQIESVTMEYIYSYNKAMEETKNPGFASQAAIAIIFVLCSTRQSDNSNIKFVDPMEIIFSNIMRMQEERNDGTENEQD